MPQRLMLWLQSRVDAQLLLDPSAEESSREDGSLLLALMPTRNMVGCVLPAAACVLQELCVDHQWVHAYRSQSWPCGGGGRNSS